ncbi:MAG: hypothetical protein WA055_05880 [Candidatus Moraniibacteriota bacterium]
MKKEIPNQIELSLKKWNIESSILQILYVILGSISISAPLIVACFTDRLGDLPTRIVSFSGAVAVGIIGGFRLSLHANKVRRAYIKLRTARVRYEFCSDYSLDNFVKEYVDISEGLGSIIGPGEQDPNFNQNTGLVRIN